MNDPIPEFDMTKYDNSRQAHELSIEQENAIDLLITGKSDGETGKTVGVARQTVWNWRNNDPYFKAELNKRRQELWSASLDRMRSLAADALDVLEEDLQQTDDFKSRSHAAYFILKSMGFEKRDLYPWGITEVDEEVNEEQSVSFLQLLMGKQNS